MRWKKLNLEANFEFKAIKQRRVKEKGNVTPMGLAEVEYPVQGDITLPMDYV